LDNLDTLTPVDTAPAWGPSGSVQIVTSVPGKILNQAVLNVSSPQMRYVIARYFNHSMQVPTACALCISAGSGGLIAARGLLAQRMVDSDVGAFVRVLEAFEDSRVAARLGDGSHVPFAGAVAFRDLLELPDLAVRETRPLMFQCRCSKERILTVLQTLTREELEERVAAGQSQDVTCHMCGRTYSATVPDMQQVLDHKS
jgi:molecular chaperone Hsp33